MTHADFLVWHKAMGYTYGAGGWDHYAGRVASRAPAWRAAASCARTQDAPPSLRNASLSETDSRRLTDTTAPSTTGGRPRPRFGFDVVCMHQLYARKKYIGKS